LHGARDPLPQIGSRPPSQFRCDARWIRNQAGDAPIARHRGIELNEALASGFPRNQSGKLTDACPHAGANMIHRIASGIRREQGLQIRIGYIVNVIEISNLISMRKVRGHPPA
jgi:hypothetical protein